MAVYTEENLNALVNKLIHSNNCEAAQQQIVKRTQEIFTMDMSSLHTNMIQTN